MFAYQVHPTAYIKSSYLFHLVYYLLKMRFVVFFLLLIFIVGCFSDLKVSIDQTGAYNITVNGKLWLRSSRTALYADNRWYSTENGSLTLAGITEDEGTDPKLGAWNETILTYNLVRNETTTSVTARIRQYPIQFALTFHLATGDQTLGGQLTLDQDEIRTVFPSFLIEKTSADDHRGYFTFAGAMTGEAHKHAGLWRIPSSVIQGGMESGPVVVFDLASKGEGDALVISPFSHFMATSLTQRNRTLAGSSDLEYGVMGSMKSIPPNYEQSLIVFYSHDGVNVAVREWGEVMQKAFDRTNEHRLNDITINTLGYYTDNGGYYYYNTESGVNYEQTIIDAAHLIKLPFQYIQLDSWWYYKGAGDGVKEWRARPDVFPDGLAALHRRLPNTPFAAHNRYWAIDNVYKQEYAFALDPANSKALPYGNDTFWDQFFVEAQNWGLVLYEQDWLNVQTETFWPTRNDINIGEQWLKSMGDAADKVGINIQYCMSLPRHILQAIEIPRVTHARASDDYAVNLKDSSKPQWNIGISSMLADAIGLAPFKDVLWSTSVQPGSPYGANAKEDLPDRAILISTLSTGPVGPGDSINYTNVQRIMRCCRSDGVILKPDRPLITINEIIADWALDGGVMPGELYATQTTM